MHRAKPDRNKTGFSITLLITGLFLLSACQSHSTATENPSSTKRPEKLVVLPFKDMASIYGEGVSVRSPLSGKVFMTGEIVQGANEILEQKDRTKAGQTCPAFEYLSVLLVRFCGYYFLLSPC